MSVEDMVREPPIPHARSFVPLCVIAALCSLPAAAPANAQPALADYSVASWTTNNGLPSNVIWAIAQDRDGYIWLGTNAGLVRFDGVRFVSSESVLPESLHRAPVRSLYAARDGSLWVGFSEAGGVCQIVNGQMRTYGEAQGLDAGAVLTFAEDGDGTLWAGTRFGLFALAANRWHKVKPESGLPEGGIASLFVNRAGVLHVGSFAEYSAASARRRVLRSPMPATTSN